MKLSERQKEIDAKKYVKQMNVLLEKIELLNDDFGVGISERKIILIKEIEYNNGNWRHPNTSAEV